MKSIVILPGLLNTAELFADFTNEFSNKFNIVPIVISNKNNIKDAANEVLKNAPESFILMGISMGGYIAMEIMRQAKNRVEKLVLMDTSPFQDNPEREKLRKIYIEQARNNENFLGVTRNLLNQLVFNPENPDEILNKLQKMAKEIGREGFINQQLTILSRPNSLPDLQNYNLPTLVIRGEHDALSSSTDAETIAKNIQNSQYEIIKNCGHLPPIEKPAELNKILEKFL